MDFSRFARRVVELKRLKPIWFELDSDPPATDSEIENAEAALGVRLPQTYKRFVREFGGGYFAFANVFSVAAESSWNIVVQNRAIARSDFVAVSDSGTGDYFGFSVSDGVCEEAIWYVDHHESGRLQQTEFSDLLAFLIVHGLMQELD